MQHEAIPAKEGQPPGRERERLDEPSVAAGPAALPAVAASHAAVLALQRAAGNRAVSRWVHAGAPALARQETPDPVAQQIAKGDWHGAAWELSKLDAPALRARVTGMSSQDRQAIVEGARHGEGRWSTDTVIGAIDAVDHRDALIGSVRFFYWKRNWRQLGTYLCGLNDDDIRRMATRLGITREEIYVIVDDQPDKAQKERLNVAFFSKADFQGKIPRDLVGKDAGSLARTWLLKDDLVGPYAAAKWHGGAVPAVQVIPAAKWADRYVERRRGRFDPDLGRPPTDDESRQRSVVVDGFTTDTDEIFLREGDNTPGRLLHEAVHALAPTGFDDIGHDVDEGTTEYFGRRVARSAGKPPSRAYIDQYAGVAALADLVGEAQLASAFFTGKVLGLQFAVDDRKGEGTFRAWSDAMADGARRARAGDVLRAGKPAPVP
jgi:hypothetical protein